MFSLDSYFNANIICLHLFQNSCLPILFHASIFSLLLSLIEFLLKEIIQPKACFHK